MSINPSTNYISADTIDAWMQMKLEDGYTKMREGMDTSGRRVDAEEALNQIKSQLLQLKTNGEDPRGVAAAMHDAIDQFGEEFPELKKGLEGFTKTLDERIKSTDEYAAKLAAWKNPFGPAFHVSLPEPVVHLDAKEIDDWTTGITGVVDGLGKADQLGILNLNQLNSHIQQTENMASALMDSRNKTLDGIINRIG